MLWILPLALSFGITHYAATGCSVIQGAELLQRPEDQAPDGVVGHPNWQDGFGFISTPNGIRLVNFDLVPNQTLTGALYPVIEGVLPDFKSTSFATDSDLITNDWGGVP